MTVRTPADRLVITLYLCAGILLAYAFFAWLSSLPLFSLRHLEVRGDTRHLNVAKIKKAVLRDIRGNFFTVDLDEVRAEFKKLPWVREARVFRQWPDTLIVEVVEHVPLACWNGTSLLSTEGIVFHATCNAKFPKLRGFEGSGEEVADAYRRYSRILAPLGMHIRELRFSPSRAWRLKTDQGLEIALGRVEPEARLMRFAKLYWRIVASLGKPPVYADLRYADGFAVKPALHTLKQS